MTKINQAIRTQLVHHLRGGMAFLPLEKFIHTIPLEKTGVVPDGLPYSMWQQLHHLRFAQKDIIDFCFNADYKEPKWPEDYWPADASPRDRKEWDEAVADYFNDLNWISEKVMDPSLDLCAPLANDDSKTLLREILLIIEHNAYHTGQMYVILRLLGLHD